MAEGFHGQPYVPWEPVWMTDDGHHYEATIDGAHIAIDFDEEPSGAALEGALRMTQVMGWTLPLIGAKACSLTLPAVERGRGVDRPGGSVG